MKNFKKFQNSKFKNQKKSKNSKYFAKNSKKIKNMGGTPL